MILLIFVLVFCWFLISSSRAENLEVETDISTQTKLTPFSDVPADYMHQNSIKWAYDNNIIVGSGGKFGPEENLTEAQFIIMLTRYGNISCDENFIGSHFADKFYEAIKPFKLPIDGDTDPAYKDKPINRGRIAQIVAAAYGFDYSIDDAIRFMYTNNFSSGTSKTEKTIESYGKDLNFIRAAAASFLERMSKVEYVIDLNGNKIKIPFRSILGLKEYDNTKYDLYGFKINANFEVEVYEEVFWVPANSIGKSEFTNQELMDLAVKTPEEKQERIKTLYDAVRLFQVSQFKSADDNIKMRESGIEWEYHKPGYYAVKTNQGCCATDSNWLNYILKEDYDEVGFFCYSFSDGSGHVMNYIKQGEYYYLIDLTHYRTDFMNTASETGLIGDYRNTDFISGNIHKTKSLEKYAQYCLSAFNDSPALFLSYVADNVSTMTGDPRLYLVIYPEGSNLNIVWDNPNDKLKLIYKTPPTKNPDWNAADVNPIIPSVGQ